MGSALQLVLIAQQIWIDRGWLSGSPDGVGSLSGCSRCRARARTPCMWRAAVGMSMSRFCRRGTHGAPAIPDERQRLLQTAALPPFFGFGDRRYLESKHRGVAGHARGAVARPGPCSSSPVCGASPGEAFGITQVATLTVSPAQAHAIQRFVWQSLAAGAMSEAPVPTADGVRVAAAGGAPAPGDSNGSGAPAVSARALAPGPYEGSLYFEATPRYSALYTCNTWVAHALAAADLPVRVRGVIFAGQVWRPALKLAAGD